MTFIEMQNAYAFVEMLNICFIHSLEEKKGKINIIFE